MGVLALWTCNNGCYADVTVVRLLQVTESPLGNQQPQQPIPDNRLHARHTWWRSCRQGAAQSTAKLLRNTI